MSILNKLKELVTMMEDSEDSVNLSEETSKAPTEESPLQSEKDPQEAESEAISDSEAYIECTEAESAFVFSMVEKTNKLMSELAELLMNFDSEKASLYKEMNENKQLIYKELNRLRLEYEIPDEGFEILLPAEEKDRVQFVEKSDS